MKTILRFISEGYTITPGAYKALLSLEINKDKCEITKEFYDFILKMDIEEDIPFNQEMFGKTINKVCFAEYFITFIRNKGIQILGYENPSYRKFFIEDIKDDRIGTYKEYFNIDVGCGFATDTLRDIYIIGFQTRHMGLDIGRLSFICNAIISKYTDFNDGICY